jgi:hypothetical protein
LGQEGWGKKLFRKISTFRGPSRLVLTPDASKERLKSEYDRIAGRELSLDDWLQRNYVNY